MIIEKIAHKAKLEGLNIYSIASIDASGKHEYILNPADACTNSYSVAKAFTVTAIGMLWDQNKIRVEDNVYKLFENDFPKHFDSRWESVTIEHLLTHKVGFGRGFLDIDVENIADYPSNDFLQVVLSEPLPLLPGSFYQYTDAAFYLLSRIVTKVTQEKLVDFLRPILFGKLGFQELAWSCCPYGFTMGATGLYIRTSDMVKLGWVYANGGKYNDQHIISQEWVNLVLEKQYEFTKRDDNGTYAKGGMLGQMLCFSITRKEALAWHAYEKKKFNSGNTFLSQIFQ